VTIPLIAAFTQTLFMLLLGSVAVFLILLVLVQRGRGGGLAGALGGMGGSSAFGAKAGDVFTKVTVVAATVWIVLCIAASKMTPDEESFLDTGISSSTATEEVSSIGAAPGAEETAEETTDPTAGETTEKTTEEDSATSETEAPSDEDSK